MSLFTMWMFILLVLTLNYTFKEEILIVDNDVPVVKEEVQIIDDNDESWQNNAHDSATTFGDLLMRHRRECESGGHPSK